MGESTKVQWAHHTFNGWIGCTHAGEGCLNCYAEVETFPRVQRKNGRELWGPNAERHITVDSNWRQLRTWNAAAAAAGERRRVFAFSLGDVLEDRRDLDAPRARFWAEVEACTWLDFLLLTKRPLGYARLTPERWIRDGWPRNAWAGASASTQREVDVIARQLIESAQDASVRFLSLEPLIEHVDLDAFWSGVCLDCAGAGETSGHYHADDGMAQCESCRGTGEDKYNPGINWVIPGGESCRARDRARACDARWIRGVVRGCQSAGVAAFVKQLGSRPFDLDAGRWFHHAMTGGEERFYISDRHVATVWKNGTWFTWDEHGTGGENDVAADLATAKAEAERAIVRQEWHWRKLRDPKGGDISEFTEDLRVREFPKVAA